MPTHSEDNRPPGRRLSVTVVWKRPFKVHRVFALAAFNIICNIAVLYVAFRTIRFGALITNGSWWITDNNLLSIIEFSAKLPAASTVFIGGVTASKLWSRNLVDSSSGGGIAELQSLNIFSSVLAIPRVVSHVVRGRSVFAWKRSLLMVFSAILLRFYSTAVVTLVTPALTFVHKPEATYSFVERPFMTQPGYGNRCFLPSYGDSEVHSCLQVMLAGSALVDIDGYNGTRAWSEDESNPLLTDVDITFSLAGATRRSIVGAIPLGPVNGADLTDGVFMTGLNMATVGSLLDDVGSGFRDSAEFLIEVETTAPLLTCRCETVPRSSDDISTVTIDGDAYGLTTPIPILQDGEAVGQVTSDNMTLLLSFGNQRSKSNTHCVVDLMLIPANITIHGSSPQSGVPSSAIASPSRHPRDLGNLTDLHRDDRHQIQEFSSYWLGGIGWGTSPNRSAVASLLAGLPVGTGTCAELAKDSSYLEYYVLTMLASGVSVAFPPENPPSPSPSTLPSTRSYRLTKREYYIGLRTQFQIFLSFVIMFDCVFVIGCLVIIMQEGWYSDWTDPATTICIPRP